MLGRVSKDVKLRELLEQDFLPGRPSTTINSVLKALKALIQCSPALKLDTVFFRFKYE